MVMVAFRMRSYKAPTDFVFFGRGKNDNNNEILARPPDSRPNGRCGLRKDGVLHDSSSVPEALGPTATIATAWGFDGGTRARGVAAGASAVVVLGGDSPPISFAALRGPPGDRLRISGVLRASSVRAAGGGSRTGARRLDVPWRNVEASVGLSHPWFLPLLLAVILYGMADARSRAQTGAILAVDSWAA